MDAATLLGLSPGFKFQPTDEELVAFYLHPRLRDQLPPLARLFIEDDPRSAPPWELLKRHGRDEEAFFFAPGEAKYRSGGRMERRCVGGGTWKGQKTVNGTPMVVNGEETRWRKYVLNFHAGDGGGSRGWVMHEYTITDTPSPILTLCRIHFCGRGNRVPDESDDGDKGGAPGGAMAPTSSAAADGAVQVAQEQGYYAVTADHQLALTAPGPSDGYYCTMPFPPQEPTLPMGQESVMPVVSFPAAYDGALPTAPGQGSYSVRMDQSFADQYPSSSAFHAAPGPSTSAPTTTSYHAPFLEYEQALDEFLASLNSIESFGVSDLFD